MSELIEQGIIKTAARLDSFSQNQLKTKNLARCLKDCGIFLSPKIM